MEKIWERFSKEEIEQFVQESRSYAQLAEKIGYNKVANNGSAYRAVHQMIEDLSLDVSHFTGQGWNKDAIDLTKYKKGLALKSGQALRDLILLRSRRCEECGLELWQGKEIPLEVHHKDGDYMNSDLSNLVLLCRNCHALTDNYGSKNHRKEVSEDELVEALKNSPNVRQALIKVGLTGKGKNYDRCYNLIRKYNLGKCVEDEKQENNKEENNVWKQKYRRKEYFCEKCGKKLAKKCKTMLCNTCSHFTRRHSIRPSREVLKKEIRCFSFSQLGRKYGISDNAIRKWCKDYSLPYRSKDIIELSEEQWEKI